mmetsp:Transcript_8590/g.16221  ORF Transcript_8590/g.16221 Transcript_8590/m.16221 type:complete len:231 (-) Transcript_8590:251-943(-)
MMLSSKELSSPLRLTYIGPGLNTGELITVIALLSHCGKAAVEGCKKGFDDGEFKCPDALSKLTRDESSSKDFLTRLLKESLFEKQRLISASIFHTQFSTSSLIRFISCSDSVVKLTKVHGISSTSDFALIRGRVEEFNNTFSFESTIFNHACFLILLLISPPLDSASCRRCHRSTALISSSTLALRPNNSPLRQLKISSVFCFMNDSYSWSLGVFSSCIVLQGRSERYMF